MTNPTPSANARIASIIEGLRQLSLSPQRNLFIAELDELDTTVWNILDAAHDAEAEVK